MNNESKRKRDDMPPVPRDFKEASHSELVPIKSGNINILKSPIFYMVVITAFLAIALFQYKNEVLFQGSLEAFGNLMWATIAYLLLIVMLVMYLYSKTDKPFWSFLSNTAFVSMLLLVPILGYPYFFIFRDILPGHLALSQTFGAAFIGMFFGAGLMEELMKVTLVLFGAYIAVKAAEWRKRFGDTVYDLLSVRGPLDGLMMGIFGGAGFILIETGTQYIPDVFQEIERLGGRGFGLAAALMLLLPRVIGGMVGHMAWAGITGYFIGLAVIRPEQATKMVVAAWIGTSALHAIWNTQAFVPFFAYLSAGVSGVFLVACLLKARQLEMSMGRSVDTYGSIVVEPDKPSAPAPIKPQVATPVPPAQLRLVFSNATVPVILNQTLDLTSIPELGDAARDIRAKVTQHPTRPDVLGLKNLGAEAWTATLRDASQQRIVPERNIRLANGVKIDFGNGLVAEVMI